MNFKQFLKGVVVWLVLNILLLPTYFWMLLVPVLGLGAIEHMSTMEKLPFLLISLIPYVIEYVVIYLVAYKSDKFEDIFNKYIIGIQGVLVAFFIFGILGIGVM